jgi:hypothetical protein
VLVAQWWLRHVAAVLMLASVLADPPAAADDKLAFGGGAGIIVDGSYCTLTTIGHDRAGELVGFTAAHCGGPGSPVVAEGSENRGPLGTVVAASDERLDYAVITFDPAKVTPIPNFAGFVINGIGPGNHEWHQPACKLGAATGYICTRIMSFPGPGADMNFSGLFQPGDDGGPVTSDDLLIGMIHNGWVIPGWPGNADIPVTSLIKFGTILDDVNANGGPGAGFRPVPA